MGSLWRLPLAKRHLLFLGLVLAWLSDVLSPNPAPHNDFIDSVQRCSLFTTHLCEDLLLVSGRAVLGVRIKLITLSRRLCDSFSHWGECQGAQLLSHGKSRVTVCAGTTTLHPPRGRREERVAVVVSVRRRARVVVRQSRAL